MIQCSFYIPFKKHEYLLDRPDIQIKEYFWLAKIALIFKTTCIWLKKDNKCRPCCGPYMHFEIIKT